MIGPSVAVTRIRTNTASRMFVSINRWPAALTGVNPDERRCERRCHLRQCERPDGHQRGSRVVEQASGDCRCDAFADDQRTDYCSRQTEMVDDAAGKDDRIDQKAGDDEESRDEEGIPMNSSFSFAGFCWTALFIARPVRNAPTMPGSWTISVRATAHPMMPSMTMKYACSSSSTFFKMYRPPRPTANSSSGMNTAISTSCLASPARENPRSKVDTHIANTTSDSVSDSTVAPTVTVNGSSRFAPIFVTIGMPESVCDARRDPRTIAVTTP